MKRFLKLFKTKTCQIIGMIHVNALPGTPKYTDNWHETIKKAVYETHFYLKHGLDAILIENMHDVPYVPEKLLGPEITACMARLSHEIRSIVPSEIPVGINVIACGHRSSLAIAKACNLQFIRAEGFVFAHISDGGLTDACAGELLRYRKQINTDHVLIFTDIKKKHSSHAITADVTLLDTARAAEFFLTDGVIITGERTADPADPKDLQNLVGKIKVPILIGSGVTTDNLGNYIKSSHGIIIGSHFKKGGSWEQEIDEKAVIKFMDKVCEFRAKNN